MATVAADTEIVNIALSRIGHYQIADLGSDTTREGRMMRANYEHIRDMLLRAHPWNWATKRATLAASSTTPNHEFSYAYPLPTDCLKVVQCHFEKGVTYFDGWHGQYVMPAEYRVEQVNGQLCIVTDEAECKIEYVSKETDPAFMDPIFVDLLATRLAAETAYAITQNRTLTEQLWTIFREKWMDATGTDAQEGSAQDMTVDIWLGARM